MLLLFFSFVLSFIRSNIYCKWAEQPPDKQQPPWEPFRFPPGPSLKLEMLMAWPWHLMGRGKISDEHIQ